MVNRIVILACCFVLPSITVHGQTRPPIEFGKVSKAELEMTSYEKDTSAVAVVLFDYGKYTPNRSIRHTRIKILKPAGLQYATAMEVVFKQEGFRGLKGSTYNLENGRMVETKMDEGSVFKEEYNDFADFRKFALNKVKVGSVIEYKYEVFPIGTNMIYLGGREWVFQRHIPTVWSEIIFEKHQKAGYDKLVQGYHPLTAFDDNGASWRWVMSNVPAFSKETNSPPDRNFISKVRIATAFVTGSGFLALDLNGSWENIGKNYHEAVFSDDNVANTRFLKDDALKVAAGGKTEREKAVAIYDYVKKTLEWNDRESGMMTFGKAVFEKRRGTSGEINLILLAMLRYAGLNAHPLLISTRENGYVRKDFPDLRQFNSVIVYTKLDEQPVLLDATDRLLPIDYLPERCINGEGLLIEARDKVRWIEVKNTMKQRSTLTVNGDFEITNTGNLVGKLSLTRTGYEARLSRKEYTDKGDARYTLNALMPLHAEFSDASISGMDNTLEVVKENYAVTLNSYATISNDVIYLDPMLLNRLDQSTVTGENRVYPFDFIYPKDQVTVFRFKVPDGYRVEELPKPVAKVLPESSGRFLYNIVEKDGVITFTSHVVFSRSLFSQVEYPALREFYKFVSSQQEQQIVIRRKS